MTLSLRDVNGCDSNLLSYRHFSKIPVSNNISQTDKKGVAANNRFSELDYSTKQILFDKLSKYTNDYGEENWSEAVCSTKSKPNSGKFLNIDGDSVVNFSLTSVTKLNDSAVQLFTPAMVVDDNQFTLEELNAHVCLLLQDSSDIQETDPFLTKLGLKLIPQTVRLHQAMLRFDNDPKGKATNKSVVKFIELCDQLLTGTWLPYLTQALNSARQALYILETFKDQYSKIELKMTTDGQINQVIHEWSSLNYFPVVLINSLSFKVLFASDNFQDVELETALANNELCKILFVTWSLEISKTFIKILNLTMDLKAHENLDNGLVISIVSTLLDATVESYTGEIMIGIDQVIRQWIVEKSHTDPLCLIAWNQWSQNILHDYKIRFRNITSALSLKTINAEDQEEEENQEADEEDQEQLADLMFDKFDIGRIFLEQIFKFTHSEIKNKKPTSNVNSLGWLTIFDENHNDNIDGLPSHDNNDTATTTSLTSLLPPASARQAIIGSSNMRCVHPLSNNNATINNTKNTTLKQWGNILKRKIRNFFHLHREPSVISSVRYYRVATRAANIHDPTRRHRVSFPGDVTTFTEDQCAYIERLTRKLYKKEKKGRRKRDALRVILS